MDGTSFSRANEIESRLENLQSIGPVLTNNYLVKGLLDRNCLSMIYGPSNAGKTFVALDIALHVAAGRAWRGLRVDGGPVVYIAAEGGAGIRNRLAAFKQDRPEFGGATFYLLPAPLDLHGQGDALALCQALPCDAPALVVVDTMARSMGKGDENKSNDTGMFIENCGLIQRSTGAGVCIIHHCGKDEDRGARGSSALRAAVDTEIQIKSDWQIISTKQRDRAALEPFHFKLRPVVLGQDQDGDDVTSAVVDPADAPTPTRRPLTGRNEVAMQALHHALRDRGLTAIGENYPTNRKTVTMEQWRNACDDHGLTDAQTVDAARVAFSRAKSKLIDLDRVRQFEDRVWSVFDDEC